MKHRKPSPDAAHIAAALDRSVGVAPRSTARPDKKAPAPLKARAIIWLKVSPDKSARATTGRRTFPIMAYVGPNGGGKSLAAVKDCLPSLRAGRRVLSTVRLLDPDTGEDFPSYERFYDAAQLLDAHDCDIFMDEMVGIANSRESGALDPRIQNVLVQLRRRNCVVRWTAPNWARADKIVREVTQSVTECRGYFANPKVSLDPVTGEPRMWAPKRLFNFRTFDTVDFEEWSSGKRDKLTPEITEWMYGPDSEVFRAYDTLDAVEAVAGMTKEGSCANCGGQRRRHQCKCATHAEETQAQHDHSIQ